MVELVASGRIYEGPQFRDTPPPLRRLNDIALSGDGEPTAFANFDQVVDVCAEVRRRHGLDDVKLVLITNASLFHRPRVRRALETLDANGGEIWAKLDAGTEDYYRLVTRSAVPWRQILDNLREAALARPIVIQSLFMRIRRRAAAAGRVGGLLRSAQGDCGRRRANQAGPNPHDRPKTGRTVGRRAGRRRGRRHCRSGAPPHGPARGGVLWRRNSG